MGKVRLKIDCSVYGKESCLVVIDVVITVEQGSDCETINLATPHPLSFMSKEIENNFEIYV